MPMYLVPIDDGEPVALDKAVLFIGRHPDCDIVLTHSRKVSRKHCCVAQINNGIVVRDLGSMNGIRVNDSVTREERPLRIGDELWVGDVGFRLEFREAPKKDRAETVKPNGTARAPLDRRFISQDVPVAIPDEDADLIIESTRPNKLASAARPRRPAESDVIELSDSDIVDDDETERRR